MNAQSVLFKTRRFNLSVVKEHFINRCCFGEDLASWLGTKLVAKGIKVSAPGQEDWGWYLRATCGQDSYLLGMNGNFDRNGTAADEGEWRIIVEKKRSVWQRVARRGRIADGDPMVTTIEDILRSDPEFRDLRLER